MNKINQTISVALFPFKDLTYFTKDLITDIAQNEDKQSKYEDIYYSVISKISSEFNIRNSDEIQLTFDKYYSFIENIDNYNMNDVYDHYLEIIKKFSKCLISHRDGKIVYKYWKNSSDDDFLGPYDELKKVEIFHNISKILSMDLLATMYLVENNKEIDQLYYFYSDISLADMPLDDVLIKGVAENHIHANASFNFNLTWEQIINERVKSDYIDNIRLNHNANLGFKEKPSNYIKLATILRLLLCLFLKENKNKFCDFALETNKCFEYKDELNNGKLEHQDKLNDKGFENRDKQNEKFSEYKNGLSNKLKELFDFMKENNFSEFDSIMLDEILDNIKKVYDISYGDEQKDVVFLIFQECNGIKTYGENIFLFKCLKYMKDDINEDAFFKYCFFQYIRIKNEFYQQVVQKKGIDGLDNFQEFFQRGTGIIKNYQSSKSEFYKLMFRTLFQNEYLKKIELRFSIYDTDISFRKMLIQILSAYKDVIYDDYIKKYKLQKGYNIRIPRLGLVFHLIKEKDKLSNKKCWMLFEEQREITYNEISFKKLQQKYKQQIKRLKDIRNEVPYLSYFILGIDAASLENNTPVQVFAPIYDYARDSSEDPLIQFDLDGGVAKYKSLAFTFHAGEDFRHIVSGLRRIDEVVEHCKFHSGDRIGHGTALGIDLEKWVNSNPVVTMPRGEYLDNLLWIWGVYTKSKEGNPRVSLYLEQEIYKVAKDIFRIMNGINTTMLYAAYRERFNEFKKNDTYCKEECNNANEYNNILCVRVPDAIRQIWDEEKINHAYQCTCYLKYINEPIFVAVKDIDLEMMKELQSYLIDILASKGIIVEVNPSSNAIIGEISEMFDNQIYTINKVNDTNCNNVMVSINSDDPMIFSTSISNEYAYIYYGILSRGIGKEKALQWIEKLRNCAMETSFIDNKISDEEYYDYLCKVLVGLGVKDDNL